MSKNFPDTKGKGPVRGTVYLKSALTRLLDKTLFQVAEVYRDEHAPVVERVAAARILLAADLGEARSDRAFDQLADRTEGRPHQSARVAIDTTSSPEQLLEDARRLLGDMDADEDE